MNKNHGPIVDDYQDDCDIDDYQGDRDISNEYISYPQNNRYNNAYGNYRGGYDRSNQGPPLGFGPIGPPGFHGPPGPPGPPPPFPMGGEMRWRRGYVGPPSNMFRPSKKDKIIRYLKRCGIPREHLVNLPNDLLMMMQPMNCGLCVQKFETNDLSRIHYASKNHLKIQKKWVNQRSNTGSQGREPLKSRDLYCELCDVHITSTGHAESHYAGKPHRSIVQGRKNPRNPFLLQPSKEGRLNALIRREMKFLKKDEPSSTEKKSKSEPKSGELYCEICKTSMMCSEQMTTHLNGKRHLSKEKQHILRLMKGEVTDDKKGNSKEKHGGEPDQGEDLDGEGDDDEDKDEDEDGDEDGDENEDKGDGDGAAKETAGADDDGWGEGGEDWKPSAEDY